MRCAVVPYPGRAHCAYISTYKLVHGNATMCTTMSYGAGQPAGHYTRVFAISCSLVPRSLACGLAASKPHVQPRSLTAALGPRIRSHTRDLEASRTRSLATSQPRSLAAFRPRLPSRTAAVQPCGLTASLVHWQPRSRPRVLAALRPPSLTGSLAASRPRNLTGWQPRSLAASQPRTPSQLAASQPRSGSVERH